MELSRLTLATGKSEDTGEAEYWVGGVRQFEERWLFEVFDFDKTAIAEFHFDDRGLAEIARGLMFKVLDHAILVAAELPTS